LVVVAADEESSTRLMLELLAANDGAVATVRTVMIRRTVLSLRCGSRDARGGTRGTLRGSRRRSLRTTSA
jgi:hypothetical protein